MTASLPPPSPPPLAGPPPPPQWYYAAADGEQQGPVQHGDIMRLLQDGTLSPSALVWREGMDQWRPAGEVLELWPTTPPNTIYVMEDPAKAVKKAKNDCIAMFVLAILIGPSLLACLLAGWGEDEISGSGVACVGFLGFMAIVMALFMAVHLPRRWRIIMALPKVYRVLGLIGGFGLILIGLTLVSAIIIAAMGGGSRPTVRDSPSPGIAIRSSPC